MSLLCLCGVQGWWLLLGSAGLVVEDDEQLSGLGLLTARLLTPVLLPVDVELACLAAAIAGGPRAYMPVTKAV